MTRTREKIYRKSKKFLHPEMRPNYLFIQKCNLCMNFHVSSEEISCDLRFYCVVSLFDVKSSISVVRMMEWFPREYLIWIHSFLSPFSKERNEGKLCFANEQLLWWLVLLLWKSANLSNLCWTFRLFSLFARKYFEIPAIQHMLMLGVNLPACAIVP